MGKCILFSALGSQPPYTRINTSIVSCSWYFVIFRCPPFVSNCLSRRKTVSDVYGINFNSVHNECNKLRHIMRVLCCHFTFYCSVIYACLCVGCTFFYCMELIYCWKIIASHVINCCEKLTVKRSFNIVVKIYPKMALKCWYLTLHLNLRLKSFELT